MYTRFSWIYDTEVWKYFLEHVNFLSAVLKSGVKRRLNTTKKLSESRIIRIFICYLLICCTTVFYVSVTLPSLEAVGGSDVVIIK